jgi:thiamine biosynthesis lipoprotein
MAVERTPWLRRARPLLGTLVEIGARGNTAADAIAAAFGAIGQVQAQVSRFEPDSDIARFHALPAGAQLEVRAHTAEVLAAAQALHIASGGLFDASLSSGPQDWSIDGPHLSKHSAAVRLDLGGIGKGYSVDCAIDALVAQGCIAGWVNAGGDLRVFGDAALPLHLRDERRGGVRLFGSLREGAFATSHFDRRSRSQAAAAQAVHAHASVAAPRCLWADALTKVLAISGDTAHPLLLTHGAQGWLH